MDALPFAIEVIADNSGVYCGNGLRFRTADEAETYARDLWARWTLVRSWRVVAPCGWGRDKTVVKVQS